MAFLPNILDDTAAGRNDRLGLIRDLIETYKRKQWGWLWTEAVAHEKLDSSLGVSSYPAMVVVNPRKNVSVKMTTGFHKEGVDAFMRNVAYGKTAGSVVSSFDSFPELTAVQEWDGKDGVVPEEVNYYTIYQSYDTDNLIHSIAMWLI